MNNSVSRYLSLIAAFAFASCVALLIFYPAFPKSYVGWIAVIFIGVPFLVLIEEVGTFILNPSFISSWPRWARISYAVMAMLIALAAAFPLSLFVASLIAS